MWKPIRLIEKNFLLPLTVVRCKIKCYRQLLCGNLILRLNDVCKFDFIHCFTPKKFMKKKIKVYFNRMVIRLTREKKETLVTISNRIFGIATRVASRFVFSSLVLIAVNWLSFLEFIVLFCQIFLFPFIKYTRAHTRR